MPLTQLTQAQLTLVPEVPVQIGLHPCRDESLKRIVASNRLILVLDLDHTLLTSTKNSEILDEKLHQKLSQMLAAQTSSPSSER